MRHFVAYHNSERMGYGIEECDPFSHYTNKNTKDLIGDIVWVIAGEGKSPKQFYLSSWFVVENISPAEHADFGHTLSGRGGEMKPIAHLNDLDWFPEFFNRMAHFSLGLQPVAQPEIIEAFQRLAAEAGCWPGQ